jgi:dipeptidyl aminopeptidase/acylaminoacyl peptidase
MGTAMPVGEAEPIVSDVDVSPGRAAYSASASGALLYRVAERGAGDEPAREALRLTVRDRGGHTVQAIDARIPWTPRFSPDGATLAYGAAPAGSDASELWTTTLATGATRQRTRDGRDANDPQWSPDGRAFAYSPTTPRGKRVVVESVDGGVPRALADVGGNSFPTGWTPDGRAVLATVDRGGNQDIVALPVDGGDARELLATSAHESGARLTRDGRWLAYQSDAGGPMAIYVRRADDLASPPIRVSGGGVHPVWRRDGRELFYWERDRLMAVAVRPTPDGRGLTIGEPTPLFRARYPGTLFAMYDVSPDGERIVVAAGGAEVERYRLVRIEGDARR